MKRILILLGTTLLFFQTTFAQYTIGWHTIDGGGGTSTGGVYAGTIGQPDAGAFPISRIFSNHKKVVDGILLRA